MSTPPISPVHVVIPAYRAEETLARTVGSVRAQDGPAARIVICDDGSPDGTLDVARGIAEGDPLIDVLTGPNRGACHARNAGLAHARANGADAVLFLDADDEIAGDYLGPAAELVAAGADLVLTSIIRRQPDGTERTDPYPDDLSARSLFDSWLGEAQVNPAGMVWRAAFVAEIGGWDEAVLINQDGEIAMRAFAFGARVVGNPKGHAIYYIGNPNSLSSKHSDAKLSNYVETLQGLRARGLAAEPALPVESIDDTIYGVARMCFAAGHTETGRHALSVLRGFGQAHHRGGRGHRIAAGLLGLEAKTRLSVALARVTRV